MLRAYRFLPLAVRYDNRRDSPTFHASWLDCVCLTNALMPLVSLFEL
jgi:hypothetical protein